MSYMDHILSCNRHDLSAFQPLKVENVKVGYLRHKFACLLLQFKGVFEESGTAVSLSHELMEFDTRTQAVSEVVCKLISQEQWPQLRREWYPVKSSFNELPLFQLDRAVVAHFGVRAFGVHVNGFVQKQDGNLDLWIARRAKDRILCPSMLDNMVAGGQPIGLGLMDNVIKECDEEAAIPKKISETATPVSAISYVMETESGLKPDTMFCFDLRLPDNFVPVNRDGEVTNFYRWPVQQVAEIIDNGFEFKFNCNLVIIDFLIRRGFISPDHPQYLELINGLHR